MGSGRYNFQVLSALAKDNTSESSDKVKFCFLW